MGFKRNIAVALLWALSPLAYANLDSSVPASSNPSYSSVKSDGYVGTGSTVTVVVGAGAGTLGTAYGSVTGTNFAGQLTVLTATLPGVGSTIATVTASMSMPGKMICALSPANALTALLSGLSAIYVTETVSTWTLTSGTTGLAGSSTYIWNYLCGGY